MSDLTPQLKEQHAQDKYHEVLEEVPRVRKDLGNAMLGYAFPDRDCRY